MERKEEKPGVFQKVADVVKTALGKDDQPTTTTTTTTATGQPVMWGPVPAATPVHPTTATPQQVGAGMVSGTPVETRATGMIPVAAPVTTERRELPLSERMKVAAEEAADKTKETAEELSQKTKEKAESLKEQVKETAESAKERAQRTMDRAREEKEMVYPSPERRA